MFDLTARPRWSPALPAASAARSPRRWRRKARAWRCRARGSRRWRKLRAELGGDHPITPCNLSDSAAVDALVGQAEQALGGRLDILVANAGITKDGLMLRMKDEDLQNVLKINLESYFRLSRAALRNMMKNRWGRIIGITSVVGVTGNPGQANYAASKAGMIGFTKALAAEVASRNVTANCIAPGFIASPMTDVLNEAQKTALLTKIPAGRLGRGR